LCFWDVFVSYCPQFWDSGLIYKAHDTQHIFQRRDQKLIVFCILGLFSWAIAHSFGVPEWFTRSMSLSTCLRGMTKNSSFLRFRAVFISYCPLFWGSMEIYKEYESLYILERNDKKTCHFFMYGHFCVYGNFCELLPTVLEFQGDLQVPWHSLHVWEAWEKTHSFWILGPFLWAIIHSFGIPGWFTRPITLNTFFQRHDQKLVIFCILGPFSWAIA
jgi:hypothetical protein